jgi:hypothetical protein
MGTWRSVKCKDKHIAGTNNSQEKHVNVPGGQSARLGKQSSGIGALSRMSQPKAWRCLEHVTAPLEPDSSPIVPPGTHNLLPPRRRLVCTYC